MESAELIAILREVRERVRARNPETSAGGVDVALPDLLPLVHARDAALGKVAAIGTVNPRPAGWSTRWCRAGRSSWRACSTGTCASRWNSTARVIAYADAAIEAQSRDESVAGGDERAHAELVGRLAEQQKVAEELKDIRHHWADWRVEWEHKLARERSAVPAQRGRSARRLPASRHADGRQLPRPDARRTTPISRRAGAPRLRYPEAPVGRS